MKSSAKDDHKRILNNVWAQIQHKKFDDGLSILQENWQPSSEFKFAKGRCLEGLDKFDQALELYLDIADPKPDVLISIGFCYEKMDKLDLATGAYEKIPSHLRTPKISLSMARCYENAKKFTEAECVLKNALKENALKEPLYDQMTECLARLYQKQKKYQETISAFKRMTHYTSNRNAIIGMGICYEEMNQFENAHHTFTAFKNWQQDPKMVKQINRLIQNRLNDIWEKIRSARLSEAEELLATVIIDQDLYPQKIVDAYLRTKAKLLEGQKRYAESLDVLEQMSAKARDCKYLIQRAVLLQKCGRYEEAENLLLAQYDKATGLENKLEKEKILRCLGEGYKRAGHFELAEKTFKRIHHWESNAKALYLLGKLYEKFRSYDLAIDIFQKIENWQNNPKICLALFLAYQDIALQKSLLGFKC